MLVLGEKKSLRSETANTKNVTVANFDQVYWYQVLAQLLSSCQSLSPSQVLPKGQMKGHLPVYQAWTIFEGVKVRVRIRLCSANAGIRIEVHRKGHDTFACLYWGKIRGKSVYRGKELRIIDRKVKPSELLQVMVLVQVQAPVLLQANSLILAEERKNAILRKDQREGNPLATCK